MSIAVEELRRDREAGLEELRALGVDVSRPDKPLRCPIHNDTHPSGWYRRCRDGAWRFGCFVCDMRLDVWDLRARRLGVDVKDLLREAAREEHNMQDTKASRRTSHTSEGADHPAPDSSTKPEQRSRVFESIEHLADSYSNVETVYRYTHPDTGAVELVVIRYRPTPKAKKMFAQASPCEGGWHAKAPPGLLPIYNRTRVRAAQRIVLVEGEKVVHALAPFGIVATTTPGGAGKGHLADVTPLAGKVVFLWADNDPPDARTGERAGIRHMRQVAALLERLEPKPRVFWIDPDSLELPPKGDAADLIEQFGEDRAGAREAIEAILAEAEPLGPVAELRALVDDTIAGRRVAVSLPFVAVGRLTRALLPGTLTVTCGPEGASKSFLLLQWIAHWLRNDVRCSCLMLEENRAFHLMRALAQLEGDARITDDRWMRENPVSVNAAMRLHTDELNRIGDAIHIWSTDKPVTLPEIVEWVRERAARGDRVICVDPVSIAERSREPWRDDAQFVAAVKRIAEQHECSVIVVTHPGTPVTGRRPTLDDIAGGRAFRRFAQTVLWLRRLERPKVMTVVEATTFGSQNHHAETDRTLLLCKARNGPGQGAEVALRFNPTTLRFEELGVVVARVGAADEHD